MKTVLSFKKHNELTLPEAFANQDVRFSDDLAAYFIASFSNPGDTVFDPFAGFGTTLYMAEKAGRTGYGIEYLPDRVRYIQSIINNKNNIICASALDIGKIDLPALDFSLTSPPYMSQNNHEEYPFAAYQKTGASYAQYLMDIKKIYQQLRQKLKPEAYAIVEISNIINEGVFTPLAWDVAKSINEVLPLQKEIVIRWESAQVTDKYGFGYDHSYCLVFKNSQAHSCHSSR